MCDRFQGVGVTPHELLKPGTAVLVPVGANANVDGPCVIAWATVRGPVKPDGNKLAPDAMWWLNVHMGGGVILTQMYRADTILGVPALGLSMPNADEPTTVATPAWGPRTCDDDDL